MQSALQCRLRCNVPAENVKSARGERTDIARPASGKSNKDYMTKHVHRIIHQACAFSVVKVRASFRVHGLWRSPVLHKTLTLPQVRELRQPVLT